VWGRRGGDGAAGVPQPHLATQLNRGVQENRHARIPCSDISKNWLVFGIQNEAFTMKLDSHHEFHVFDRIFENMNIQNSCACLIFFRQMQSDFFVLIWHTNI
jgi:hypothetical protein